MFVQPHRDSGAFRQIAEGHEIFASRRGNDEHPRHGCRFGPQARPAREVASPGRVHQETDPAEGQRKIGAGEADDERHVFVGEPSDAAPEHTRKLSWEGPQDSALADARRPGDHNRGPLLQPGRNLAYDIGAVDDEARRDVEGLGRLALVEPSTIVGRFLVAVLQRLADARFDCGIEPLAINQFRHAFDRAD